MGAKIPKLKAIRSALFSWELTDLTNIPFVKCSDNHLEMKKSKDIDV